MHHGQYQSGDDILPFKGAPRWRDTERYHGLGVSGRGEILRGDLALVVPLAELFDGVRDVDQGGGVGHWARELHVRPQAESIGDGAVTEAGVGEGEIEKGIG